MEKLMSKSNDSSKLDHHTLADSELDAVSGGFGLVTANATGDMMVSVIDQKTRDFGTPSPSAPAPAWSGWPIGW
jgi:hypothetical protein